jgi:hypothetical protein
MIATLTKWETTSAPAVAIEPTDRQSLNVFWGAVIPAIPDLLSLEQARTGMSYDTALNQLLHIQRRWIQQLHGENRFVLSLRLITTGNPNQDLIFGLIGKTEGQNESETITAARNFYNKLRDTFPNGYPLEPCQNLEQLSLLRLPFLADGTLAEFRRNLTPLPTITSNDLPDAIAVRIDPWLPAQTNFQELFRALLCHTTPAAIAINLRPTQLSTEENSYIANQARLYANIASISRQNSSQNRVQSSSVTYQDKLIEAEQASQTWTQLQTNWRSPFEMITSIIAESPLPQSVLAALKTAIEGQSTTNPQQASGGGQIINAQSKAQKIAVRQNWANLTLHRWSNHYDLGRLPWLFSPEEVHSLFRLPIADRNGVWGLPSAPGANDARRPPTVSPTEAEIRIGSLHLSKKHLTQHLLISGVPGSGKTNTSLYLLETLWREYQIPWMVLEPAKTEYRGLKSVASLQDDLLIFTLGDERVAPFRFNPLALPTGINLDSHQGALLDLFAVSMSMWGPLPSVLEQLMQEAYKRKGFTILGDNSQLKPPRLADLVSLIPEIVPKLGYKKETTDEITAAIAVRLNKFCRGALGQMLNTTESVPFEQLMQQPVIFEMSQITNSDDRAFIMGLILNRCYQYWTARRHEATGELKHLLLVEEAHNLLANASESNNQEQANPKGKAVRNFANMLAEVRGFGQGIAIAEQNPNGLIPDVLVNTNIKLAHRIVEAQNRETLGRSMLLTPQQEKSLASLGTGQMLYYLGGQPEPSITNVPNFKDADNGFNPRLQDAEIRDFFEATFKTQFPSLYAPPAGCPTAPHLFHCIEQGIDLVEILINHPDYQFFKENLILQLLAAPFGAPTVNSVRQILGKILSERGANHLNAEQIQATINSGLSRLALIAVQEKGKVHGWLGEQGSKAHDLLVQTLLSPTQETQTAWIELCRIPEHLLALGLPSPAYQNSSFPGVFRYENKLLLAGDRGSFTKDMQNPEFTPSQALQNWVTTFICYPYLDTHLKSSLVTCLAIQLTEKKTDDLLYFLS